MSKNKLKSVCVFCGSNPGNDIRHSLAAQKLGKIIAGEDLTLVYGGGNVGIMGELANSVLQYNGKVIGVIPKNLVEREVALKEVTELKIVTSMHERKTIMSELSDGFIAMSGGIGTLEELFEIWAWAHLGIHSKPIGLLNINGYYDSLVKFITGSINEGFMQKTDLDMIILENDPETLIEGMKTFKPPHVRKWINTEET